jgi:hypothetical protein
VNMRAVMRRWPWLFLLLLFAFIIGCKQGGRIDVSLKGTFLMWNSPQEDVNGTPYPQPNTIINGFNIYFSTSSGVYLTEKSYNVPASITSIRIEDIVPLINLAPNVYYCVVTALDIYGNESGFSNEVQIDTTPMNSSALTLR